MGLTDLVLMAFIISGAIYLLYRSLWKQKGHCAGCDAAACDIRKR